MSNLFLLSLAERGVVVLSGEGRNMIRAELGHDISLDCDFGDDDGRHDHQSRLRSLYSIKWYRDDREFFRYIPTGQWSPQHWYIFCKEN